jgi:hypothetical protein
MLFLFFPSEIKIAFLSAEHATFAMNTLQVDAELQAGKIAKTFKVVGSDMLV